MEVVVWDEELQRPRIRFRRLLQGEEVAVTEEEEERLPIRTVAEALICRRHFHRRS